jgi:hypothetical protein
VFATDLRRRSADLRRSAQRTTALAQSANDGCARQSHQELPEFPKSPEFPRLPEFPEVPETPELPEFPE